MRLNQQTLIIVDDGSSDNTVKIAKVFEKEDACIFVMEQDHSGASSARKIGIDRFLGNYIAFLDSNDYVSPIMYETV